MINTILKGLGATSLVFAFASGTAFAGDGMNCENKTKTQTEASVTSSSSTAVLGASERVNTDIKKTKRLYSLEDATEICQKKRSSNLQACIDYKTGKTQTKAKS